MENLDQKIRVIEERNKRVETDKAWVPLEVRRPDSSRGRLPTTPFRRVGPLTGWAIRALLSVLVYVIVGVYLWAIEIPRPWLNAIVPAVAFMLSTLTMPFFKKLWVGRQLIGNDRNDRDLIKEKETAKKENLDKLREYIQDKERVTNDEVENFLGVSNATAERYLDELEKEELLEQVGHIGQGVYYKVRKVRKAE